MDSQTHNTLAGRAHTVLARASRAAGLGPCVAERASHLQPYLHPRPAAPGSPEHLDIEQKQKRARTRGAGVKHGPTSWTAIPPRTRVLQTRFFWGGDLRWTLTMCGPSQESCALTCGTRSAQQGRGPSSPVPQRSAGAGVGPSRTAAPCADRAAFWSVDKTYTPAHLVTIANHNQSAGGRSTRCGCPSRSRRR